MMLVLVVVLLVALSVADGVGDCVGLGGTRGRAGVGVFVNGRCKTEPSRKSNLLHHVRIENRICNRADTRTENRNKKPTRKPNRRMGQQNPERPLFFLSGGCCTISWRHWSRRQHRRPATTLRIPPLTPAPCLIRCPLPRALSSPPPSLYADEYLPVHHFAVSLDAGELSAGSSLFSRCGRIISGSSLLISRCGRISAGSSILSFDAAEYLPVHHFCGAIPCDSYTVIKTWTTPSPGQPRWRCISRAEICGWRTWGIAGRS